MRNLTRTNFSVKDLTDMYAVGEIAIPEIQRDFVWGPDRTRKLLDSLHNDYPSGAIILWRPEFRTRGEFEMHIRPERFHLYKHRLPKFLLLDGQQRLTALCSVVLPAEEVMGCIGEEIDLPRLFLNLRTLDIEARRDSGPPSNNEVRLNRVLSRETENSGLASVLAELAARKDITAKHRNALKEFREGLLAYTYPVQIIEGRSYEKVAEIFRRVNSQGKILVTAEIELAKIVPHWRGFAKHLRTFMREMRGAGFGADLSFYIKCLAFIATGSPAIDSFSRNVAKPKPDYSTQELERFWKVTKSSIRRMHSTLFRHGINRTELITTRNALVPMVYAIAKDKRRRIEDGMLIRWLIYAMKGEHYGQRTESVLRRDSKILTEPLHIEKGFANLYRHMIREKFVEKDFEGSASKNPAMLAMYLGLHHYGATDFAGKNAPSIGDIPEYQVHHIFPTEFMLGDAEAEKFQRTARLRREQFKEQINDIANLTFISPAANGEIKKRGPYDYLAKMTTERNLEAHCIPKDRNLWRPMRFDEFCRERRGLLAKSVNGYIRALP